MLTALALWSALLVSRPLAVGEWRAANSAEPV
jgi:hypothetical protein